MAGRTDFITDEKPEDVWLIWYVLVDDAYQALEAFHGAWRTRGPAPIFSDSEVITVALIIDTWFHGHEALGLSFLRHYHHTAFPKLPPDGWFNARRTLLGPLMEQVRRFLTRHHNLIAADDPDRLIDSLPIPVCTYNRARENQTVNGPEYFGVMKSRGAKLFGLRLHVTTTTEQVIDDWLLAPASHHDSQVMPALLEGTTGCLLLGDGAYNNPTFEPLFSQRDVTVYSPPRRDNRSRTPWPQPVRRFIGRVRRRIETVFSVLTTVFDIERPRSRSLKGLVSRVCTRLLAYNLCFLTQPLLVQLRTS